MTKMGLIVWLTAGVFMCGAVAYLTWFFPGNRATDLRLWTAVIPPRNSTASAGPGSTRLTPALRWRKRLLAFVAGACAAAFIFAGSLYSYLSPPVRPVVPVIALGYTHFFKAKHGGVYGTYFEQLAVTFGIWVAWGGLLLTGLVAKNLKVNPDEGSPAYPLLFFVGSATSMVLYYALWHVPLYLA
jgi:hypothetical protein